MNAALARALAAAHVHRDEKRFEAVIREIIVNERDPIEIEKWRMFLVRQEEEKTKPKAATLADGQLTLVDPVPLDAVTLTTDQRTALDAWLREMRWREALRARRIPVRNTALFHGATGTGKTMLSAAIASALDLPYYTMRAAKMIGKYVGETSQHIGKVLGQARGLPMVIVCDEIDTLSTVRGGDDDQAASVEFSRTTNVFIQELDRGVGESIFIGTTNVPHAIDSAIRRRLSFSIEFPTPTRGDVGTFMSRIAARYGIDRVYLDGPASYAEAEHQALNDVRDQVIAELENPQ